MKIEGLLHDFTIKERELHFMQEELEKQRSKNGLIQKSMRKFRYILHIRKNFKMSRLKIKNYTQIFVKFKKIVNFWKTKTKTFSKPTSPLKTSSPNNSKL